MDCSMPALPVLHDLLEFAQFHACQFNWWCYPTISSSVTLSCLQSFPAAGSFPMSSLFASNGQSIGASASVLLKSIQSWLPLALTGLMSFLSKRLSRVFSSTTIWKHQFLSTLPSLLSHPYMTTGKTITLNIWTFVGKVISLLFNTLSRFVIVFCQEAVT